MAPRSYEVECNGRTYRRNRKDLRLTPEQLIPMSVTSTPPEFPATQSDDLPSPESTIEVRDTGSNVPTSE